MKFFNLDCHISVIEDIKCIYAELGHQVDSWSISGHNWVFGRSASTPEVINADTWRSLNSSMIERFNEKYGHILSGYDGFICTYPPAFARIFAQYGKPIIVQIPIRYEIPYCNNAKYWYELNDFLINGHHSGLVKLISNSVYDAKYFESFTGIYPRYIQSYCDYTKYTYCPTKSDFLSSSRLGLPFDNIVPISLLGRYRWSDIGQYRGVVVIPYNASQMSIFEFYAANMPLFCPSYEFLLELMKRHPDQVMPELSWNRILNLPSASVIRIKTGDDPNNYQNVYNMHNWSRFSDIYVLPHITYFSSYDELEYKLKNTNLATISELMRKHNIERKTKILSDWKDVLSSI